jgi:peptidyl-tRNA hydrolase, PTH1 family
MKLIVGLGNPGKEYEKTRHNVGFLVLDKLASKYEASFDNKKFNGKYCKIEINDEKVILLKPQKYMNLSGEVIKEFVQYYKINIEDLIIIHDDLDINIGDIKIKPKGSSGGHNGLNNIELMLNTSEYKRVKIGISNTNKFDAKDYVLGKFSSEEFKIINEITDKVCDVIFDSFNLTFENLMNKYN